MLGIFGRRAIDLAVLFLALYAFAFVPLGRHTGLEHLRAILGTPAAREAGQDLLDAAERLQRRLFDDEPARPHGNPAIPHMRRARSEANLALAPLVLDAPDASL